MVDERLLEHWQRQRAAREQARTALPASWLEDARPEMKQVVETYVEAIAQMKCAAVLHLVPDDR